MSTNSLRRRRRIRSTSIEMRTDIEGIQRTSMAAERMRASNDHCKSVTVFKCRHKLHTITSLTSFDSLALQNAQETEASPFVPIFVRQMAVLSYSNATFHVLSIRKSCRDFGSETLMEALVGHFHSRSHTFTVNLTKQRQPLPPGRRGANEIKMRPR